MFTVTAVIFTGNPATGLQVLESRKLGNVHFLFPSSLIVNLSIPRIGKGKFGQLLHGNSGVQRLVGVLGNNYETPRLDATTAPPVIVVKY